MTVNDFIKQTTKRFSDKKIESSDFEARQIAEFVFKKGFSEEVTEEALKEAETLVLRRLNNEPLQYILGEWEFYGLPFKVGQGVLIPRADTEVLVEKAFSVLKGFKKPVVYDLCAGSGCIGITLAKMQDVNVIMVEKSNDALGYLNQNVKLNNVDVKILQLDVLNSPDFSLHNTADIIVSNPPYIKSDIIPTLSQEVQKEPKMALDGGDDGLLFYRYIAKKWKNVLKKGGYLLFEIGFDQKKSVEEILKNEGYIEISTLKDYGGNNRVVIGKKVSN